MSEPVLGRRCPAKLNLGLRVLGRRADGYHEIDSVFHALALHDVLWLQRRPAPGIDLRVRGGAPGGLPVATGADNLVHRAVRAYYERIGEEPALALRLRKRIPAGGGLGGGSSDAAACLLLLERLHRHALGRRRLHALAVGLGADVPFFLTGGTMRATGIGDRLQAIAPAPRWYFALVLPGAGTDTGAVYNALRSRVADPAVAAPETTPAGMPRAPAEQRPAPSLSGPTLPSRPTPMDAHDALHNDLEEAALACVPELAEVRDAILDAGYRGLRMSGSGSTFYVPCPDLGVARRVAADLAPRLHDTAARLLVTRSAVARPPSEPDSLPGLRRVAARPG